MEEVRRKSREEGNPDIREKRKEERGDSKENSVIPR